MYKNAEGYKYPIRHTIGGWIEHIGGLSIATLSALGGYLGFAEALAGNGNALFWTAVPGFVLGMVIAVNGLIRKDKAKLPARIA